MLCSEDNFFFGLRKTRSLMKKSLNPVASTKDLVIQELGNETLVYNTSTNQACCLNETAAFVWSNCKGDKTIDDIAFSFEEKFGRRVSPDFVRLAVSRLKDKDLLVESGMGTAQMTNRREAIRKIGLATAIAIPVVASLIAPPSAMAQTSSCRCVNPGGCITQTVCPSTNNCNPSGVCAP